MKSEDLAATESAAMLAARIRRKEISPVEAVDIAIARIEKHNAELGAVIIVICALAGAVAAAMQGLVAYEDLACRAGWPSFSCAQDE